MLAGPIAVVRSGCSPGRCSASSPSGVFWASSPGGSSPGGCSMRCSPTPLVAVARAGVLAGLVAVAGWVPVRGGAACPQGCCRSAGSPGGSSPPGVAGGRPAQLRSFRRRARRPGRRRLGARRARCRGPCRDVAGRVLAGLGAVGARRPGCWRSAGSRLWSVRRLGRRLSGRTGARRVAVAGRVLVRAGAAGCPARLRSVRRLARRLGRTGDVAGWVLTGLVAVAGWVPVRGGAAGRRARRPGRRRLGARRGSLPWSGPGARRAAARRARRLECSWDSSPSWSPPDGCSMAGCSMQCSPNPLVP